MSPWTILQHLMKQLLLALFRLLQLLMRLKAMFPQWLRQQWKWIVLKGTGQKCQISPRQRSTR